MLPCYGVTMVTGEEGRGARVEGRIMNGRMIENHGGCCARDENEMSCLKFGECHALVIQKLLS